jgi:hypothetical protein
MNQIRDEAQPETGGALNSVIPGRPVRAEPEMQRLLDRDYWMAAAVIRPRMANEGSLLI